MAVSSIFHLFIQTCQTTPPTIDDIKIAIRERERWYRTHTRSHRTSLSATLSTNTNDERCDCVGQCVGPIGLISFNTNDKRTVGSYAAHVYRYDTIAFISQSLSRTPSHLKRAPKSSYTTASHQICEHKFTHLRTAAAAVFLFRFIAECTKNKNAAPVAYIVQPCAERPTATR